MEKFKEQPRWLRFGLSAVVALVLLFAMVFEVSIPLPLFEGPAQAPLVVGIESQAVRERIAIDARSDSYFYNGADLIGYSDDHSTQTWSLDTSAGALQLDGEAQFEGQVSVAAGADSDAANYDYMVDIQYAMTGVGTKDRNYGLLIEGTRAAGQELTSGDHDEAGLKIRVDTEAVTTTAGTVLRAIDAEAKADNPGGTVTSLYGASVTAKSDTSAGDVGTMVALSASSQNNAAVDDLLAGADIRIMRQSATVPTEAYLLRLRNSSTTGAGANAGIYMTSDYADSASTDSMDYGVDMSSAAINTAELRLSNGETINNVTDTAIQIGGFLAYTEGTVIDLSNGGTITPVATYQPITNDSGGSITTSASTAIADGVVAGQMLILINEDAQDIVIKDGANTALGGDITLTGGALDSLMMIWDGADWTAVAMHDN